MEAKRMAKEIDSILPSTVIEIILCHVPLRDAVRTSILSRNWRYKWATIPKLVFDFIDMFPKSIKEPWIVQPRNERKQLTGSYKFFYAIHQVMLLHRGSLLELSLSMHADNICDEIDQIMLYLLRKGTIKKLALDFVWESFYKLPLYVQLFHQLTDLSLSWCYLDFHPTFSGFGSLTRLSLYYVYACKERLFHLISTSPLLRRLSLELEHPDAGGFSFDYKGLLECLSVTVIEHLTISSWTIESFETEELSSPLVCRKYLCMTGKPFSFELSITLVYLKYLRMTQMLFSFEYRLFNLFVLIKSSPNLEVIQLKLETFDDINEPEINSLDDYSDIWLEHLSEFEIEDFPYLELALEFVKLILAKSPVLKIVRIVLGSADIDEELKILRMFLSFPRASPAAKII